MSLLNLAFHPKPKTKSLLATKWLYFVLMLVVLGLPSATWSESLLSNKKGTKNHKAQMTCDEKVMAAAKKIEKQWAKYNPETDPKKTEGGIAEDCGCAPENQSLKKIPTLAKSAFAVDGKRIAERNALIEKTMGSYGFEKYSKSPAATRDAPDCHLTPHERAALFYYTNTGYQFMNKALRTGEDYETNWPFIEAATAALAKLGSYKGMVKRGSSLPSNILEQYEPGKIVTEKAFVSTSAGVGFHGNTHFIIFSKTGKYIAPISDVPTEDEVLFMPGTRFKVLEKKVNPDEYDMNYIVMEEVSD